LGLPSAATRRVFTAASCCLLMDTMSRWPKSSWCVCVWGGVDTGSTTRLCGVWGLLMAPGKVAKVKLVCGAGGGGGTARGGGEGGVCGVWAVDRWSAPWAGHTNRGWQAGNHKSAD
jgi:hypothetical protein